MPKIANAPANIKAIKVWPQGALRPRPRLEDYITGGMRCTGATGQSLNAHRGLKWAAEYLSEKLWRTFAGTVFLQTGCMVYCQTDRWFIGLILQGLANLWPADGLNIYGRDCQIIRFVIRSYKVKTSLQADR